MYLQLLKLKTVCYLGGPQTFTIALKEPNPRLIGWRLKFETIDFKIKY